MRSSSRIERQYVSQTLEEGLQECIEGHREDNRDRQIGLQGHNDRGRERHERHNVCRHKGRCGDGNHYAAGRGIQNALHARRHGMTAKHQPADQACGVGGKQHAADNDEFLKRGQGENSA